LSVVAIIPARGGSKRLPRKNIKEFCGIPLIAWSIIQAKNSRFISEVFVTTDDDEIEEVAISYGAKVIRRPEWSDVDSCSAVRPLLHACDYIKNIYNEESVVGVFMLPTAPINKPSDIDSGLYLYFKLGVDMIRPLIQQREVALFEQTGKYFARAFINDKSGMMYSQGPGWTITSIDWYLHFYSHINNSDSYLDDISNWPKREVSFYPVESWQFPDTDTEIEFKLGELIFEQFILKGRGKAIYEEYKINDIIYAEMVRKLDKEYSYRDTFSKEAVEIINRKNNEFDISKIIGNLNQQ